MNVAQNQTQVYQKNVSDGQIKSQAQAIVRPFVQDNIESPIITESQEIEDDNTTFEEPPVAVPKPMFDAICDMCGEQIQVPFQPDGKRPTFCKECLKDYQRMTAKEKIAEERRMQREHEEKQATSVQPSNAVKQKSRFENNQSNLHEKSPSERIFQPKSYVSNEKPLSLSQMQHIAPKKFRTQRPRPNVNLDEVRNLIKSTQSSDNSASKNDDDYDLDRRETGR